MFLKIHEWSFFAVRLAQLDKRLSAVGTSCMGTYIVPLLPN